MIKNWKWTLDESNLEGIRPENLSFSISSVNLP